MRKSLLNILKGSEVVQRKLKDASIALAKGAERISQRKFKDASIKLAAEGAERIFPRKFKDASIELAKRVERISQEQNLGNSKQRLDAVATKFSKVCFEFCFGCHFFDITYAHSFAKVSTQSGKLLSIPKLTQVR